MIAQPDWTSQGEWGFYAGPGLALATGKDLFYVGIAGQVGLEYTFEFPLQISVDVRPYLGMHSNTGIKMNDQQYAGKSGFYNAGLAGFIPSISVKYRF